MAGDPADRVLDGFLGASRPAFAAYELRTGHPLPARERGRDVHRQLRQSHRGDRCAFHVRERRRPGEGGRIVIERGDFRQAHELDAGIRRLEAERGRVGTVGQREWVARPIRGDQRSHIAELGVDDRRLHRSGPNLGASELDDQREDQEEEGMKQDAQAPGWDGTQGPCFVISVQEILPTVTDSLAHGDDRRARSHRQALIQAVIDTGYRHEERMNSIIGQRSSVPLARAPIGSDYSTSRAGFYSIGSSIIPRSARDRPNPVASNSRGPGRHPRRRPPPGHPDGSGCAPIGSGTRGRSA